MSSPKVLLAINYYSGKNEERAKYLDRFLRSIKEKTIYENYDIVIFDDRSPFQFETDEKLIVAREAGVRWHIVRNRLYRYFLEHPEYKYLFAYDEDYVVVQNNWMTHLVNCMENVEEIGILGAHWARLEDGVTKQKQHTPVGVIDNGSGYVVHTNKYATGGCWTIRREVIEAIGLYPEDGSVIYDSGHPGADTYYGWEMMEKTKYKLCTTLTDLVMHTGQEFMKGKFAEKYNTKEFQAGKRLY